MSPSLRVPRPSRQRDILVVFTQKVASQGYDATSLSEIAEALGLSKGTIMHHYGAKDRLFRLMALEYMQRRNAELDEIFDAYEDPAQRLASIVTAIVTAFRDDGDATRAFSREFMRLLSDPVMDEVRHERERYTRSVQVVLQAGIDDGVFHVTHAAIVTLQIIGMCNWAWTWLDPAGPLSVDEISEVYVDTIMRGVHVRNDAVVAAEIPGTVKALREAASRAAPVPPAPN